LIARQRANLRRTFAQSEQPTVDAETMRRLSKTEQELATVTTEFADGMEARFGPMPCLREAITAMESAVTALDKPDAKGACSFEEAALAGLIQARQNIRKLLSQSNSSQASECRKFDVQQKQKLRPPKKDDKEDLAKLQQEIEKLAKEEKKFSEEIESKSDGGASLEQSPKESPKDSKPSQSKSGSKPGSSSSGESQGSPAERQEQAAQKAAELQRLVQKDDAMTDLARERMDNAAKAVRDSADAARDGRDRDAGKKAAEAAEELDRLARQVAALKAKDLANRLANAQRMAQELAKQQQGLNKEGQKGKGQAAAQQGLSEEARSLADVLKRTETDADGTDPKLGKSLRQASEANPPAAIAEQMRRAADALRAGQNEQARKDGDQSAKMLDALAQQLDTTRRAFVQPQLEKLMAAEKKAAGVQKALNSVTNEQQKAEAEKKLADLRDTMESLQNADGKLSEAAGKLAQAVQRGGQWNGSSETPRGLYKPPVVYTDSVGRAIQGLQSRIQELILKDILLDKDEAVPPQYKKLVEEYYRVLSEDLR
jgi:hypothetical protein